MMKVLMINGSFRKANCKYVLEQVALKLGEEYVCEFVDLRDKNIKFCSGCMTCHKSNKCVYQDDMVELLEKIKESDLVVLASPNYFGNMNAITKNFIDRTCPFHEEKTIASKPFAFIYLGDYKPERTLKQLSVAFDGFKFNQKISNVVEVAVQSNGVKKFADSEDLENAINLVAKRIKQKFNKN